MDFRIDFNHQNTIYYPGQMLSGRIFLNLHNVTKVREIKATIKGKAKFKWDTQENHTVDGKTEYRTVTYRGKEEYLKSIISLVGGEPVELVGEHFYDFGLALPNNLPSTFNGEYGGIQYYITVKLDIPWAPDKKKKTFFEVINLLNLNDYSNLKAPCTIEKNKTYCCFCCASGPLTITASVPQTGFTKFEQIPITVDIDNASNVDIRAVNAYLIKEIEWKAVGDFKRDRTKIKSFYFGTVNAGSSQIWSENMSFPADNFPNIQNCSIIKIKYELQIEADAKLHSDLNISIPITIGDISLKEGNSTLINSNQLPSTNYGLESNINPQVPPSIGFKYSAEATNIPTVEPLLIP